MKDSEIIAALYEAYTGENPESIRALKGSGSSRGYFLIDGSRRLIGTVGTDRKENEAFIYLADFFHKAGVSVPEVVAVSSDRMAYLQTDCGNIALFECLDRDDLIEKAIQELIKIQFAGEEGLDWNKCFPVKSFDKQSILWDLNYFKYCFLKPIIGDFDEPGLESDFERMAEELAVRDDEHTFMVRDFQSRNVLVNNDGNVTLIDFQGGRRGPVYYDLASFLWQARAGFSDEFRQKMVDFYLDCASDRITASRDEFKSRLRKYVLLRQLQTLGAYGFRGLVEQKAHFVKSIPQAIANLKSLITADDGFAQYPCLIRLLGQVCDRFHHEEAPDGLTVRIGSFSYMKGIPSDMSGNGGGFVFDCRGLPNPGRYEQYKKSTGRDGDVIEFLEKEPDVERFVRNAVEMVSISVETYLQRGFTSLMVNFGCTGGQHRSVYCAEQTAKALSKKYGVRIILSHREQGIKESIAPK